MLTKPETFVTRQMVDRDQLHSMRDPERHKARIVEDMTRLMTKKILSVIAQEPQFVNFKTFWIAEDKDSFLKECWALEVKNGTGDLLWRMVNDTPTQVPGCITGHLPVICVGIAKVIPCSYCLPVGLKPIEYHERMFRLKTWLEDIEPLTFLKGEYYE